MKKVMCIKQGKWICEHTGENVRGPKYGEECSVIDIEIEVDDIYYVLSGYEERSYNSCQFIPLSDIDECNIAAERQVKEKVCES